MDADAYVRSTELVVALLAAALLVGLIATRLRIPYAVALLVASLPLKISWASAFAPSLLVVFLPALVFEASWQLDLDFVRRSWRPIAFLAVPGVACTALSVAVGLSLAHVLPFPEALLLGAIVSATDPIAVSALFKELAAPAELAAIVEGESLSNDGIAAALYTAVLAVIGSSGDVGLTALHSVGGTVGGVGLGIGAATIIALAMRRSTSTPLQIVATIVASYAAYSLAEHVHASGIFAVLITGVALRAYRGFPSSAEATAEVDRFWGVLAFIANALVFLLLGLRIDFARIFHEPALTLLTIGLVLVPRILLVVLGLPILGIRDRGWHAVIVLAGMRGALSLALALVLPVSVPFRAEIIDAVFGVVSVTLVVQGLAIGPVLRRVLAARDTLRADRS